MPHPLFRYGIWYRVTYQRFRMRRHLAIDMILVRAPDTRVHAYLFRSRRGADIEIAAADIVKVVRSEKYNTVSSK